MNLYDRCIDASVRLEAASAADSNEDLLVRGRTLAMALDQAAETMEGADRLRTSLGIAEPAKVEVKSATQAVRAFRGGLSKHGPKGFQHQPASNLQSASRELSTRVSRWAGSLWKRQFESVQPLLDREERTHFVGGNSNKRTARSRAQALRAAQRVDPILEADKLNELLGGSTVADWLTGLATKAGELSVALDALDAEHNALSPEVQDLLTQAASPDGFPLESIDAQLLEQLRAAGVLNDLVVRRP